MNKKNIFLIIGIFWIVIIGWFISIKEFTLRTGNEILLKTVPVDPRDLFRGDYVILKYEISTIDTNTFSTNISDYKVGESVYVSLNIDSDKIGNIAQVTKNTPENSIFIKWTIKNIYWNNLNIEYGIESYFVPEGKGKNIEQNRGEIYTKVAIDKFGNAIIKSLIMDGKEVNLN